jgi:DNA topoisomerase IB
MPRLRRSVVTGAGLSRRRRGKGWCYLAADGSEICDPQLVARIESLVIPPAWRDVWISPHPNGHIQALGTDVAGRRQYLYHPDWRRQRDAEKFDRVLLVADRLPAVRERVDATLRTGGLTRERVLAAAVRLLDLGFFRIGSEEYAEANHTYGLATIRKEHVTVSRDGIITFDYPAKHSKQRVQTVADPPVCAVVSSLKRRRGGGAELLAYRGPGGSWVDVRSADVNEHLRELFGVEVSAKDFRTWHATVLAAVALAVSVPASTSPTARKRAVARAVTEVSHYLGNTPAVCRASYIDPRVIDRYDDGLTIADDLDEIGVDTEYGSLATHGAIEQAVLSLLRDPAAHRRRTRAAAHTTAVTARSRRAG